MDKCLALQSLDGAIAYYNVSCAAQDSIDTVRGIAWSIDGENWTSGTVQDLCANGQITGYAGALYLKLNYPNYGLGMDFVGFSISCTSPFKASGDLRSLFFLQDKLTDSNTWQSNSKVKSLSCTVRGLFQGCTTLYDASGLEHLPGAMPRGCDSMFKGCINLSSAPKLPETSLGISCYASMFEGCSSLTCIPSLPAVDLPEGCYQSMFKGCTSILSQDGVSYGFEVKGSTVGASCCQSMFESTNGIRTVDCSGLSAKEMAVDCYNSMFKDAYLTSLAWPDLNVSSLAEGCFDSMFAKGYYGSGSALDLPAKALAPRCYARMFSGCTIASTPKLPAEEMRPSCYMEMFTECRDLTVAPDLPAQTLAPYCYNSMFKGCTQLSRSPELPALSLQKNCYESMFQDCSSLESVKPMHASNVANYCCRSMFQSCTRLKDARDLVLSAQTLADGCFFSMFGGCSTLTAAPQLMALSCADSMADSFAMMFVGCSQLAQLSCHLLSGNFINLGLDYLVESGLSTGTIFLDYGFVASLSTQFKEWLPNAALKYDTYSLNDIRVLNIYDESGKRIFKLS